MGRGAKLTGHWHRQRDLACAGIVFDFLFQQASTLEMGVLQSFLKGLDNCAAAICALENRVPVIGGFTSNAGGDGFYRGGRVLGIVAQTGVQLDGIGKCLPEFLFKRSGGNETPVTGGIKLIPW